MPNEREAAWQLREGAWICLIEASGAVAAGGSQHTLLVADIDSFVSGAAARGIEHGSLEPVGGLRQSLVTDPDGNRLKVAGP